MSAALEQPMPPLPAGPAKAKVARLLLVGAPNVGKSALFNALTGRYAVVSNYPGTTVEVTRGRASFGDASYEVMDTPGMYSLLPVSEEERVTQRIVLEARGELVLHLVDAKSLERGLGLTLQLHLLGARVILVLNMMDEAVARGLEIDAVGLAERLGVPVVKVTATSGEGVPALREEIARVAQGEPSCAKAELALVHPPKLAQAVEEVAGLLGGEDPGAGRLLASLLLQGDEELGRSVGEQRPLAVAKAAVLRAELCAEGEDPGLVVAGAEHQRAQSWVAQHVRRRQSPRRVWADRVGTLLVNPLTGLPVLAAVLYFGLYQFVGVFGAGVVVDAIENRLFEGLLNPWFEGVMQRLLPGEEGAGYWLRELFAGEYGLVTLGVRYAVAIVLPIVSLFFLFFSVLEDSGYFPRLALLVDRVFKRIGLNGRAVIPVVLGFACDTMATLVTRVQETRRERVITTFLLALAVPCSAQYGVMAGMLAGRGGGGLGLSWAFAIWAGVVGAVFLIAGFAASKLLPGQPPSFFMELPPMRLPRPANVLVKTLSRMRWYFVEILPLFLLASALIWVGRLTGAFGLLTGWLVPVVEALGLPAKAAEIFLFGFFRRDFGAAGLYQLAETGALGTGQILVAAVTLTLFMPCVAQVLVMGRERGAKATAVIVVAVVAVAFFVGLLLRLFLGALGLM